jgi:F-type H+-transporting ATPase subunit delta
VRWCSSSTASHVRSHFRGGLNFLELLAAHKRLSLIPEILEQNRALGACDAFQVRAKVTVAKVPDMGVLPIAQALKRRFGRRVQIDWIVDPELIGGAIVRVGDTEIDGSLKGALMRLRYHLIGGAS